jgi:hypothetical protein
VRAGLEHTVAFVAVVDDGARPLKDVPQVTRVFLARSTTESAELAPPHTRVIAVIDFPHFRAEVHAKCDGFLHGDDVAVRTYLNMTSSRTATLALLDPCYLRQFSRSCSRHPDHRAGRFGSCLDRVGGNCLSYVAYFGADHVSRPPGACATIAIGNFCSRHECEIPASSFD